MPRTYRIGLMAAVLIFTLSVPAIAQDDGDGERVPVYSEPVYITVESNEPLALYVRGVDDNVASVAVVVKTTDGWVQLTPCDNIGVPCMNVKVEAAGTREGDIFYLGSE
jgi:hypothetical protein